MAIVQVTWCTGWSVFACFTIAKNDVWWLTASAILALFIYGWILRLNWPIVHNYIVNGYKDDDE